MKRSEAIELLTNAMVEFQEDPAGLLNFIETELKLKPLRYISNGCMCGHFDACHCCPGSHETDWERETNEKPKFHQFRFKSAK